jgi:hypothetical protein
MTISYNEGDVGNDGMAMTAVAGVMMAMVVVAATEDR